MIEQIRRSFSLYSPKDLPPAGRPSAAVLIPLYKRGGQLHIILTKRSEWVANHKGEISFPGGVYDKRDKDLLTTALRESEEEIGLKPRDVEIIGRLDDLVGRFHVRPYIGSLSSPYPYPWRLRLEEVSAILDVPVAHLLDQANIAKFRRVFDGQTIETQAFQFGEHVIWGATARMLGGFLNVITGDGRFSAASSLPEVPSRAEFGLTDAADA